MSEENNVAREHAFWIDSSSFLICSFSFRESFSLWCAYYSTICFQSMCCCFRLLFTDGNFRFPLRRGYQGQERLELARGNGCSVDVQHSSGTFVCVCVQWEYVHMKLCVGTSDELLSREPAKSNSQ